MLASSAFLQRFSQFDDLLDLLAVPQLFVLLYRMLRKKSIVHTQITTYEYDAVLIGAYRTPAIDNAISINHFNADGTFSFKIESTVSVS